MLNKPLYSFILTHLQEVYIETAWTMSPSIHKHKDIYSQIVGTCRKTLVVCVL